MTRPIAIILAATMTITNGGTTEGTVTITVDNAVMCDYVRCVTNDNEVIEPAFITEEGKIYVYRR